MQIPTVTGSSSWQITPDQSMTRLNSVLGPPSANPAELPATHTVAIGRARVKLSGGLQPGARGEALTLVVLNAHRQNNQHRVQGAVTQLRQLADVRLRQATTNTGYGCALGALVGGVGAGGVKGAAAGPMGAAVGAACGGVVALGRSLRVQRLNAKALVAMEEVLAVMVMYQDITVGALDDETLINSLVELDEKRAKMSVPGQVALLELERLLHANTDNWFVDVMKDYEIDKNGRALKRLYPNGQIR